MRIFAMYTLEAQKVALLACVAGGLRSAKTAGNAGYGIASCRAHSALLVLHPLQQQRFDAQRSYTHDVEAPSTLSNNKRKMRAVWHHSLCNLHKVQTIYP